MLAMREHGREKMMNDLILVMVIIMVNGHGARCIVTKKINLELTIYVLHKSATVFDRWVDNEERVGDFLWAANEPSGGTFQVKIRFQQGLPQKISDS